MLFASGRRHWRRRGDPACCPRPLGKMVSVRWPPPTAAMTKAAVETQQRAAAHPSSAEQQQRCDLKVPPQAQEGRAGPSCRTWAGRWIADTFLEEEVPPNHSLGGALWIQAALSNRRAAPSVQLEESPKRRQLSVALARVQEEELICCRLFHSLVVLASSHPFVLMMIAPPLPSQLTSTAGAGVASSPKSGALTSGARLRPRPAAAGARGAWRIAPARSLGTCSAGAPWRLGSSAPAAAFPGILLRSGQLSVMAVCPIPDESTAGHRGARATLTAAAVVMEASGAEGHQPERWLCGSETTTGGRLLRHSTRGPRPGAAPGLQLQQQQQQLLRGKEELLGRRRAAPAAALAAALRGSPRGSASTPRRRARRLALGACRVGRCSSASSPPKRRGKSAPPLQLQRKTPLRFKAAGASASSGSSPEATSRHHHRPGKPLMAVGQEEDPPRRE